MKVHLVDGTYELFRSHFGQPERLAPDGMHVSAVRGLIMTLIALLNQPEVTHIAVAFDSSIKSFRNELLPTYKDGSDTPLELKMQFPLAERPNIPAGSSKGTTLPTYIDPYNANTPTVDNSIKL